MSRIRVENTKPRRTQQEIEENKKWTKKKLLEILDFLHCDLLDIINLPITNGEVDRRLFELSRCISSNPERLRGIFNRNTIVNTNKFQLYRELFDEDEKHFKYDINYKKLWEFVKWKLLRDLKEEGIEPKEEKEDDDSENSESTIEEDWNIQWIENTEQWLDDYVRDGIFYK